ncbi:hypothetical protein Pint_07061 [Pistacia integerrima]|uniref:Uncharacterized protein n=1 Tax=Pistacia integerrima TaxID=434235 RepID=A0ACC0XW74_9ROSI|nr:hypothetical protein Pint_07061 [Pistacia integerrima]
MHARSRQPMERYKKLLAELFPRNQDAEPNDRKIVKLCEYASKNPLRIPKFEIGSISSNIKILQEKSMDVGLKLKNRKIWFLLGKFCVPEDSAVILIFMEDMMVVKE